jgi:hypothetical protein
MSRAKKIFVVLAILFLLLLAYVSYDISTRTTFPGSGKKESQDRSVSDSIFDDSLRDSKRP